VRFHALDRINLRTRNQGVVKRSERE
jgi:hypothetical protein